jgi:uncharacterized protein YqhQ
MIDTESPQADAPVCRPQEHTFGGQAVIEGVMMRGRHSWAVAVRRPNGEIARASYALPPTGSRSRWLRLPIVRGVVSLYESMSLGIKALGYSANIGMEAAEPDAVASGEAAVQAGPVGAAVTDAVGAEPGAGMVEAPVATAEAADDKLPHFGWKEMTVTVLVAVAFAVGLFVVLPLAVVKYFEDAFANPFLFNLVEGLIRIFVFLVYILVISLLPDLRRVFMYHGAEHKVIHAYEHCGRADAEEARKYRTLHPRCGTGFLLLVMVIAVLLFAIVGKPSLPWLVLSRIVGIPLIIGISYEVGIKWAGKHADSFFPRILLWPGIQLQRLTTREPTDDQLEIAAVALEEVMRKDEAERSAAKAAPVRPAEAQA